METNKKNKFISIKYAECDKISAKFYSPKTTFVIKWLKDPEKENSKLEFFVNKMSKNSLAKHKYENDLIILAIKIKVL